MSEFVRFCRIGHFRSNFLGDLEDLISDVWRFISSSVNGDDHYVRLDEAGDFKCCQNVAKDGRLRAKQKGWNRWIPALFESCERGELNPHEHTLTAT